MERSYADVVRRWQEERAIRELSQPGGSAAVIPAAGRVIALSFGAEAPNLLWAEDGPGGPGGERLWFGPEIAYFWTGEPDWVDFGNNAVPPEMDPGSYHFIDRDDEHIALRAAIDLRPTDGSEPVCFTVERTIRLAPAPIPPDGLDYVGIETTNAVSADTLVEGRLDLWHLLQVHSGSTLVVPLNPRAFGEQTTPVSYASPGSWVVLPDQLRWTYTGQENAKFGLAAGALTGRSAVLRRLEDRWVLLVRDFPIDPAARYVDHPYGSRRHDLVFQAWDGFGFGEMEFHSPAIAGNHAETDRLWAYGGERDAISAAAHTLLGVDVNDGLHE